MFRINFDKGFKRFTIKPLLKSEIHALAVQSRVHMTHTAENLNHYQFKT